MSSDRRAFLKAAVAAALLPADVLGQAAPPAPGNLRALPNLTWDRVPNFSFTFGVPSQSPPLGAYISGWKTIVPNLQLPPGITFDPVTTRLVYDGKTGVASASGTATADDGKP